MGRRIAKGRMVPQSRSTDPRFGRVSLKASQLYDRMWINADDQGRLSGDPDGIKYTACPNLPDISPAEIPQLLGELENQKLILTYNSFATAIVQMLDWWGEQKLQWAYPSEFSPSDNWTDHLRYHLTPSEIVTDNWPPPALPSRLAKHLPSKPPSTTEPEGEISAAATPPSPPLIEKEEEEGEGRSPSTPASVLGSTSPSPDSFSTDRNKLAAAVTDNFRHWFGHVEAKDPYTNIPREPIAKELAQMRDLVEELVAAGGCPLDYIRQAFREAGGQTEKSKHSVRYVRKILFAWLDIEKNRSP